MMAPLHFKQRHTPHLSAVSMLLMLSLSAGSALSQTAPTDLGTTAKPIEDAKHEAYAAAIASCERLWDRDTHMTKQEWSSTCRRVQARLKQMELRQQ
jgi:hypothetical protein